MNIHKFLIFVIAIMVSGCVAPFLLKEARVRYVLQDKDGLMVSNWITDRRTQSSYLKAHDGEVDVKYRFIIENIDPKSPIALDLKRTVFKILNSSLTSNCGRLPEGASHSQTTDTLTLAPGEKSRLECHARLRGSQNPKFATSDAYGTFEIPYSRTPGRISGTLALKIKIKIEDFQKQ